ncbi:hypothetical protein FHS86_000822 [Roseimarinus sediminis]
MSHWSLRKKKSLSPWEWKESLKKEKVNGQEGFGTKMSVLLPSPLVYP